MHIFNVWTIIVQNLNIKGWILLELQIPQTRHHLSIADGKFQSSIPVKKEKEIMKRAQNRRCTSPICEQSLAKFEWKEMKTFGVTDYTNLAPLKCSGQTDAQMDGQMDRRSGPTTRPAFAKATQVKIYLHLHNFNIWLSTQPQRSRVGVNSKCYVPCRSTLLLL